jgi:hypothetical protein
MNIQIIRVVLWVVIAFLAYKIVSVVYADIRFSRIKAMKETARVERMEKIRSLQFAYRDQYRKFSKEWDELLQYGKEGKIMIIKTTGDPNDTTIEVKRDTSYISVIDSLFQGNKALVDSLPLIPYSKTQAKFALEADKINLRQVMVDVFQITDIDPIYQDPEQKEPSGPDEYPLQIGNMGTANYDLNRDPRLKK